MTYAIGDAVNFTYNNAQRVGRVVAVSTFNKAVRIEFACVSATGDAIAGRIMCVTRPQAEVTKYEGPELPSVQAMLLQLMRDTPPEGREQSDT